MERTRARGDLKEEDEESGKSLDEEEEEEDGGESEEEANVLSNDDDDDNVDGDNDDGGNDDDDEDDDDSGSSDDEEEEEEDDIAETTAGEVGNDKVKTSDKNLKRQRSESKEAETSTRLDKRVVATMVTDQIPEVPPSDEPSVKRMKLSKAELYKPPTNEELNQLKETENLFHSTLFRMQVQYFCLYYKSSYFFYFRVLLVRL